MFLTTDQNLYFFIYQINKIIFKNFKKNNSQCLFNKKIKKFIFITINILIAFLNTKYDTRFSKLFFEIIRRRKTRLVIKNNKYGETGPLGHEIKKKRRSYYMQTET